MPADFNQTLTVATPPTDHPRQQLSNFWQMARNNVRLLHQSPPIQLAPRNLPLPLSFNQERLWNLERLQPNTSVHNLLHSFRLVGSLQRPALEHSLQEITQRHEVLRTTFPTVNGQPIQQIASHLPLPLTSLDLRQLPPTQQEREIQHQAIALAEQPFDLMQGPLWRIVLLQLSDTEHVLLRTIHHIIFDGLSHSVFVRELGALYTAFTQGETSPLLDLPVQYADVAWTQRQWFRDELLALQLDFWHQLFAGKVEGLELPIDTPRPATPSYQGAYQSQVLSPALTTALKTLSAQHGVSLFVTLFAAFNTLLHQYTGQEDLVICSPVSGRHRAETRGLIGYFNNVVALRNDLSHNPQFSDLLERVSHCFMAASHYQDMPLQLVAELPSLVRVPLTRAMFVLQNTAAPSLELAGLQVSSVFVDREIANFDLSMSIHDRDGQLTVVWQYKTDLFHAERINQMMAQFHTLLEGVTTNANLPLSDLPRLPELPQPTPRSSQVIQPELALGSTHYVAPRNAPEQKMVQIWQRLLGVQPIGVEDNFFDLGGHSLLAVRLFAEIELAFGKPLPLSTLLAAPTIAQLVHTLEAPHQSSLRSGILELRAGQGKQALFLLPDGDGETLLYRHLATRLDPAIAVYGVQPYACDRHPILQTRIGDMVNYYIDQIRQVQPQGPYFLGGSCAGGVLAFEIARQLQIQGQCIGMVAIIDGADVAAEQRAGYMSEQRLTSFRQVFRQPEHLPVHRRVLLIAHQISQKIINLISYEVKKRIKNFSDRAKLQAFRYCLDRKLPMPQILHHIPVRTMMVWAQQEYVPDTQFHGEVLLFRATEATDRFDGTLVDDTPYVELYSDPLLGWDKRVRGNVQAYDISGGHSSMLQPPYVQEMADVMQSHINQFLAEQPTSSPGFQVPQDWEFRGLDGSS
ncbi:condensation domain-containing protein [Pantanalinema rosaneae CENA516]|uniref:condensation domain-containing protein n=1 Tax=Pantanalinema rosaneae TaxID=1620701 RepID=UPI003D6DF5CD